MLEHDELLPVEEQHPALVRELRNVYQLTPEERRVLARVHERIASTAYPLPAHEPIQLSERIRQNELVDDGIIYPHPFRTRKRWVHRLNAIAGIIFLTLLLGSLVLTFTSIHHSSVGSATGSTMRIWFVPANTKSAIPQEQMDMEGGILMHRFLYLDAQEPGIHVQLTETVMFHGQPRFLVEFHSFGGGEMQIINTLLQVGVLDFWNTGPISNPNAILDQGAPFDPAPYIQYNPGGHPLFTSVDFEADAFSTNIDPQTGHTQIEGKMKGNAISRFETFTASHTGYGLTITLDGKVMSSANIQSAINGPFVITGNYTEAQIQALISVLKYGPLPFALKVGS